MKNVKWGIIAPGRIADKFAAALNAVDTAELFAVASRDYDRAERFARKHDAQKAHTDYLQLVQDPDVDIVYVASPHTFHAEHAVLALEHGKPVLCEKPMTINSNQSTLVFETAHQHNVFCMEALWTRFMPVHQEIQKWVSRGAIGEIQMIQASFGFSFDFDPSGRLFDPYLAGGSLLDLGIYPITFAQMIMGDLVPERISAVATKGITGVDENLGMFLQYEDGAIANLSSSTRCNTDYTATILGTKGKIVVPMFWCAESAELYATDRTESQLIEKIERKHFFNGYEWEILEAHNCLRSGSTQSEIMPWDKTLNVIQIMDEIRNQIGVFYPSERPGSG